MLEHEAPIVHTRNGNIPAAEGSFTVVADRLSDNIAAAALRLADAGQDFAALIQSFMTAGKELEAALAMQRELGAASLKAVQDARDAAEEARKAAGDARGAQSAAEQAMSKTESEFGTVSTLAADLRTRIAALSVLAAPMPGAPQANVEVPAVSEGNADVSPDQAATATPAANEGGQDRDSFAA